MKAPKFIRRITLYVTALLLAVGYPLTAMADTPEAAATDSSTAAPADQTPPPKTYTYNAATGHWDSNEWYYDAASGTYKPVPPAPTTTIVTPNSTTTTPTTDSSTAAPSTQSSSDPTVDSTNAANQSTAVDSNTNATSNVGGSATSGDASVLKNTTAGSATSGDAASAATIVNSVNSTIAAGNNAKAADFTYNVMGDVNGDIMLYPMMLKTMLESQASPSTSSQTVSATQNNQLTNNVNLAATSGNATVANNTTAGNATTGSASTVANIMNILNSMIAAKQSFVGTINIYGSLTGDILIAPDFIPQMITNNKSDQVGTVSSADVNAQNTSNIVNNISLAAQTGSAAVLGNTKAGDATSGAANSNVVIFNLTGHDIIASNSLLVFVNVLGKWVGVIVDAPAGATSAMIGENVSKNAVTPDLTVNAQNNNSITNNVTLVARSGDAVVSHNTNAGNATSGNASALANVANISNSQIGISNWFGILFINVFGDWYGSFGVNTPYGDPVVQNSSGPSTSSGGGGEPSGVFVFVPKSGPAHTSNATVIDTRDIQNGDGSHQAVLAAATHTNGIPSSSVEAPAKNNNDTTFDMGLVIAAGSLLLVGLSAIGLRRLLKS